jgi:acetyltransferase-like isoleucine patch superfamily enzyme
MGLLGYKRLLFPLKFKQKIICPQLFFFPVTPPPGLDIALIRFNRFLRGSSTTERKGMNKGHVLIMTAAFLGACLLAASCATTVTVPAGDMVPRGKYYKKGITSVTIGEGTTIGAFAFMRNKISILTIPEGVTIENGAFGENQISSLTIPESATIGDEAFVHNKISSLIIPKGVTIGSQAFKNNQIISLALPEGAVIGDEAFAGNQISILTIPKGAAIWLQAFAYNPLTRIVFEGAVTGCWVSSFGVNEVGFAVMNGLVPGVYSKEGNNWLFNGAPLPLRPARLLMDHGIQVVTIDGAKPDKFDLRSDRTYLVPAGLHTVEVKYGNAQYGYGIRPKGSVTFEHRYLFEGGDYLFTGTPEGDQIIFRIVPQ